MPRSISNGNLASQVEGITSSVRQHLSHRRTPDNETGKISRTEIIKDLTYSFKGITVWSCGPFHSQHTPRVLTYFNLSGRTTLSKAPRQELLNATKRLLNFILSSRGRTPLPGCSHCLYPCCSAWDCACCCTATPFPRNHPPPAPATEAQESRSPSLWLQFAILAACSTFPLGDPHFAIKGTFGFSKIQLI